MERSDKYIKKIDDDFKWVERVSTLMDSKYSIGGFRFGLDPLLNFIPILGQVTTFGISIVLVIVMYRNGASSKLAVKMLLNAIADAILGSIPLVGNVADFFVKANKRNVNLLRQYYYEGKHQGSARGILSIIFFSLLAFCGLVFYVIWQLGSWVVGLF